MNKKLTMINMGTTLVLQLLSILNGFVVPRLVLSVFGSEINGLVASLTQFLGYIQLLEGGVTGVVMAALYKALADNDIKKISGILKAVQGFFKKIGTIYIAYTVVIAIVYPLLIHTTLSWLYVFALTLILAGSTISQYMFALTYRTLIISDRRGYIVSITQAICMVISFFTVWIIINVYPQIHIVKIVSTLIYFIQPLVFNIYVKKHYVIEKNVEPDHNALRQRWDGFGQNLAYFIHTNTDIVILTFFTDLKLVSVYAVYLSVVTALKTLIISLSSAIKPSFGNVLNTRDIREINQIFDYYEIGLSYITTVLFSVCMMMIVPFVDVYTSGIMDANYHAPEFAIILCLAEAVYCFRDPYVSVAYAAGHFRETSLYAYIEAALNIVVSLLLVKRYGLVGIAVGTLIAMLYRMIAQVFYASKHIIYRPKRRWAKSIVVSASAGVVSLVIYRTIDWIQITGYLSWAFSAAICGSIVAVVAALIISMCYHSEVASLWKTYFKR